MSVNIFIDIRSIIRSNRYTRYHHTGSATIEIILRDVLSGHRTEFDYFHFKNDRWCEEQTRNEIQSQTYCQVSVILFVRKQ